jgi:predicted HTH domain antitoxin
MSKTVSTRLNEDEKEKLDQISNEEHIDRSTLIRKFIIEQLKLYEMKKKGELYRKGLVSLQEAAYTAGVSLYEMMDYVRKEEIHPPRQSYQEIQEEIDEAQKYFNVQ